ncbi:MAG: DUF2974 domain-containing protein [Lachnospiraceae bacterium]|nr:DUF2974 domain-containing protein [Lachnospiraceae bacterium]
MANILDYLDWRGDLTFDQSPFNEVDNLLLSQLVYVDLEGIVPGPESREKIRVAEASRIFFATHDEKKILEKVSMTKTAMYVLKKMAESERYKDALLGGYVNDISIEEQSQFAVLCVYLGDRSLFVAFSGTDDTIVGWRENFNMGYLDATPGQKKAVAYLNNMVGIGQWKVRVGGHSKGGNLAVYSAVHCRPIIKRKIISVYSNDGPGFSKDMVASEAYQEMIPKIQTIIPESSIVGLILEHEEEVQVVKSTNVGVGQHDAMSWEVLGTHFVYTDKVAKQSVFIDETMRAWLMELNAVQREIIVEAVFEILDELNIRTVDDFTHLKFADIQETNKIRKNLPAGTQELLSHAIKLLFKTGKNSVEEYLRERLESSKLSKK